MISTRLIYKKVIYRHTCTSCGHEWEDSSSTADGCPHCTPPSVYQDAAISILKGLEEISKGDVKKTILTTKKNN